MILHDLGSTWQYILARLSHARILSFGKIIQGIKARNDKICSSRSGPRSIEIGPVIHKLSRFSYVQVEHEHMQYKILLNYIDLQK